MSKIVSISEAASIALHGVVLIAMADSLVNVGYIAEKIGSSRHHVAKVMQRLVKDGFLMSHRGPTGGFALTKKPSEITFLQLYEAIEGKITLSKCPLDKPVCPFDKCIMNGITKTMTIEFKKYLSEQTLDLYL